jgi:hypothetical protein
MVSVRFDRIEEAVERRAGTHTSLPLGSNKGSWSVRRAGSAKTTPFVLNNNNTLSESQRDL